MFRYVRLISFAAALFLITSPAVAQWALGEEDIDTIMEEKSFDEAVSRYNSIIFSAQPEAATRLGFFSANEHLNVRTPQQNAQILAALLTVQEAVDKIDTNHLSAAKQIDYTLFKDALAYSLWQTRQNRFSTDPLYYAEAFDAIYDLTARPLTAPARQRNDLAARLEALPQVAAQAEKNLKNPNPFLAQLAMEKAYYAYLSADDWKNALQQGIEDEDALAQAQSTSLKAKQAAKKMFDLFKQFSKEQSTQDFRLGENNYFSLLKTRYQWQAKKPAAFLKELESAVKTAQKSLTEVLEPLQQQPDTQEITVVDGINQPQTTVKITPADKKKKKNKNLPPLNAQDFYAVAKLFMTANIDNTPLQTLEHQTQEAQQFLTDKGFLPPTTLSLAMSPMGPYYSYTKSSLFLPSFGTQTAPRFELRIPSGNKINKQEQFNKDFNAPTRKLLISGELIPGRYYQAQNARRTTPVRQLFPSVSMQNGWTVYAKHLAHRAGYLSLDEDLLFLAWDEYQRALAAWVDAKLHTQQYTYAQALEFLTQTHGLSEEDATAMLKNIATHPGEAVSYQIGLTALENAHEKFRKKQGKKFNEADFNSRLAQLGNVPPNLLEKELNRLYQEGKQRTAADLLF